MVGVRPTARKDVRAMSQGRGVLEGAFLVLEELGRLGEAGLSQLTVATGLPKTTTHRLLEQLVRLGAINRDTGGRYRVGTRSFQLGQLWQPGPVLRTAAAQPLRRLAAATGGSVSLGISDAVGIMIVAGVIGEVEEVFSLRPGAVLPPASAAEVVMATSVPGATVPDGYSAIEWRRRIISARDHGVAIDYEVDAAPVGCVAAPVHAPTGAVVAAVGIAVFDKRRLPSMGDAVREIAGQVSVNLSRIPHAGRALSGLATPAAGESDRD